MANIQKSFDKNNKKQQSGLNCTLMKRQWAKYISKGIALSLIKHNPESRLSKSYKNTLYCNDFLISDDVGRLTGTYCKNRWCQVCNRIKTGKLINNYLPQLQTLVNPVFVTLTLPTVPISKLKERIAEMEKNWRQMYKMSHKAKYKKSYQPMRGIRKAECTIRPNGLYHYHFHVILEHWSVGEWIIGQWLKRFPDASPKAQDIRLADEFSHRELFKYAFKSEVKANNMENAKRYDAVFNVLRGKRTIQAFGGIRIVDEEFTDDELVNDIVIDKYNAAFKWMQDDWYDKATGEALVGLAIPQKVKNLVSYPDEEK